MKPQTAQVPAVASAFSWTTSLCRWRHSNPFDILKIEAQFNLPSSCEIQFNDPLLNIPLENGLVIGSFIQIRAVEGMDAAGICVFFGRVESLEVLYENVGGKYSIVRAYDHGHQMMHGQKSMGYPLMTYSAVAESVGAEYELETLAAAHPVTHQMIVQSNESSWNFLVRLGREIGYVLFIAVNGGKRGSSLDFLVPPSQQKRHRRPTASRCQPCLLGSATKES